MTSAKKPRLQSRETPAMPKRWQFHIDGRPAGAKRETKREAEDDAIAAGYAHRRVGWGSKTDQVRYHIGGGGSVKLVEER